MVRRARDLMRARASSPGSKKFVLPSPITIKVVFPDYRAVPVITMVITAAWAVMVTGGVQLNRTHLMPTTVIFSVSRRHFTEVTTSRIMVYLSG